MTSREETDHSSAGTAHDEICRFVTEIVTRLVELTGGGRLKPDNSSVAAGVQQLTDLLGAREVAVQLNAVPSGHRQRLTRAGENLFGAFLPYCHHRASDKLVSPHAAKVLEVALRLQLAGRFG